MMVVVVPLEVQPCACGLQDFKNAGKKWTVDLCKKDSDGDGFTNGQELGDPSCIVSNVT